MLITTGMSAPPMGMMMSTPRTNAIAAMTAKGIQPLSGDRKNARPNPIITIARTRLSRCWPRNTTGELAESNDAPGERNGADEAPDEELEAVAARQGIGLAERARVVHHGYGDQHRRHAHQRRHRRDQLGHLRHLPAPRDERPDHGADRHGDEDERDLLGYGERHQNGDRHADHAEEVPASRRYGRGQAFQREDEKDARREVP